jgi:hypothetical protein
VIAAADRERVQVASDERARLRLEIAELLEERDRIVARKEEMAAELQRVRVRLSKMRNSRDHYRLRSLELVRQISKEGSRS